MRRHPLALAATLLIGSTLVGPPPTAAAAPTVHTVDVRGQASLVEYTAAWEGLVVYSTVSRVELGLPAEVQQLFTDSQAIWTLTGDGLNETGLVDVDSGGASFVLDGAIEWPVGDTVTITIIENGATLTLVFAVLQGSGYFELVGDLGAVAPATLERRWAPTVPSTPLDVRPGDIVRVLADDGTFTVGPEGDWAAVQRSAVITVDGSAPGLPALETTVDTAGAQLDATVPRPSWRSAGGELALRVVATPSGATPAGDELALSIPLQYLDAAPPTVDRVTGVDRFHVAEGIAERSHPGGAGTIVIANGLGFADALSAAPAAARLDAPLLLTYPWQLPTGTAQRIAELAPATIVVVGGAASVSPAVVDELAVLAPGAELLRFDGADRFAASRSIVRYVFGTEPVGTVYLATGRTFPDALSAGAAAGAAGEPVLLVDGLATALDADTLDLLGDLRAERVAIAGGPASVSPGIEQQLRTLLGDEAVVRLSGADRFAASHAIARAGFATAEQAFIATGLAFPDALAGAAWAAAMDAPLYVVPTSCVPAPVLADLAAMQVERVTLLGGPVSLTAGVAALAPCP